MGYASFYCTDSKAKHGSQINVIFHWLCTLLTEVRRVISLIAEKHILTSYGLVMIYITSNKEPHCGMYILFMYTKICYHVAISKNIFIITLACALMWAKQHPFDYLHYHGCNYLFSSRLYFITVNGEIMCKLVQRGKCISVRNLHMDYERSQIQLMWYVTCAQLVFIYFFFFTWLFCIMQFALSWSVVLCKSAGNRQQAVGDVTTCV